MVKDPLDWRILPRQGLFLTQYPSLATAAYERILMAALDVARASTYPAFHDMPAPAESPRAAAPTFRQNLIRVMAVQVGALLLLWLLQRHYTG